MDIVIFLSRIFKSSVCVPCLKENGTRGWIWQRFFFRVRAFQHQLSHESVCMTWCTYTNIHTPPPSVPLPWACLSHCFGARSHLLCLPSQAGAQQEHHSYPCGTQQAQLFFRRRRKEERKIKNSPVKWRAEVPPEDSWHNNLNDQMIQRRLVSAETAS